MKTKYTLIRAKRRTMVIQVKPDGTVVVRAPMKLAKREIDRFVQQKEEWIMAHREELLRQKQNKEQFFLSDGNLPLFGELLSIEYTQKKKAFYQEGIFFLHEGNEQELRAQTVELYRIIAREELIKRVAFYAPKLGVKPAGIRINGAKGRWGSCSGKNSLNFSWRLMLVPEHCVNYVVVHELCHILHHDHSRAFWQEVERFFPDWRECREQLAEAVRKPWFFSE